MQMKSWLYGWTTWFPALQRHVCALVVYLPIRGTDEKLVVRLDCMVSRRPCRAKMVLRWCVYLVGVQLKSWL